MLRSVNKGRIEGLSDLQFRDVLSFWWVLRKIEFDFEPFTTTCNWLMWNQSVAMETA